MTYVKKLPCVCRYLYCNQVIFDELQWLSAVWCLNPSEWRPSMCTINFTYYNYLFSYQLRFHKPWKSLDCKVILTDLPHQGFFLKTNITCTCMNNVIKTRSRPSENVTLHEPPQCSWKCLIVHDINQKSATESIEIMQTACTIFNN